MVRGAVPRTAEPPWAAPLPAAAGAIGVGRPPWWLIAAAVLVTALVSADLLAGGRLEQLDLRVSELVGAWDLQHSGSYRLVWLFTQAGGRGAILVAMGLLLVALWRRHRTFLPLVRVVLALALLTAVVYAFKWGMGRTAPGYPGSFFHRDGASYPSGHVANAVLMWGVARWQVVSFGLPGRVQRLARAMSQLGPVATGVAMVALDFHWVTDAVAGGAVGIVLLGVVHLLDAQLLPRWTGAGAGRRQA